MLAQFIRNLVTARLREIFYSQSFLVYAKSTDSVVDPGLPNEFSMLIIKSSAEYHSLIASGCDFSVCAEKESIEVGLKNKAILICIFQENNLAHTTWVALDHSQALYDSLFRNGQIGEKTDAFIGPCNTYIPFRGLGLYPSAIIIACNYIQENCMQRAIINTKVNNFSSIKGIEKAGFKIWRKVKVFYVFGKSFSISKCHLG